MSATFWISYGIIFLLSLLGLAYLTEKYKSRLVNIFALFYLVAGPLITGALIIYGKMSPFRNEQITQGIIKGEDRGYTKSGYITFTTYVYQVNGQEYIGYFRKRPDEYSGKYKSGDTIDVTYNQNDPESSCATFSQYWYVNSSKQKYWLKIKKGEGRRRYSAE